MTWTHDLTRQIRDDFREAQRLRGHVSGDDLPAPTGLSVLVLDCGAPTAVSRRIVGRK
jgi:hypothetical protein